MANLKKTTLGLIGPLALAWFIALAGLALAVAGLATLTNSCGDRDLVGTTNNGQSANLLLAGANGIIPYSNCGQLYEFQWFHLALQAFVVLGLFVTMVIGMRKFRFGVMALLTIATVFMIIDTNIFLGYYRQTKGLGKFHTRSTVAFVGFLISAAGNMLAIMLLGAQESTIHTGDTYNNRAVYGSNEDLAPGVDNTGPTATGKRGGGLFGRKQEPVATVV